MKGLLCNLYSSLIEIGLSRRLCSIAYLCFKREVRFGLLHCQLFEFNIKLSPIGTDCPGLF